MPDRGAFWSPVPDWPHASLASDGLRVTADGTTKTIWLVSGDFGSFERIHGDVPIRGPRDSCPDSRYRLRLAKDRLLQVSPEIEAAEFGWSPDGHAITDVSDGMVLLDVTGPGADRLMARGCGYDFAAPVARAVESAMMIFAGTRLAVSRRGQGWRLHVDRPLAAALWRWLAAATE